MQNSRIFIWDEGKYAGAASDGFRPTLNTYILDGTKPRAAVLICPGGGYEHVSLREGEPIALQFNATGLHAFVLTYSVAPRRHPQPLLDLMRALSMIRENVVNWHVDPEKIAVCGFSAGGHLAASLATYGSQLSLPEATEINREWLRPNALILCYPVITSGQFAHRGSFNNLLGVDPQNPLLEELSLERRVHSQLPPVFIWHTFEDQTVPVENTLLFAQALRAQHIQFEMHIFPQGAHGLSLATMETAEKNNGADPHVARWMGLCIEWLKETLEIGQ